MSEIKLFKKKNLWLIVIVLAIIAMVIAYYYFRVKEGFEQPKLKLNIKDKVSVFWDQDGKWYDATVTNVSDTGNIDITYNGYSAEHDLKNITPWDNVVRKI